MKKESKLGTNTKGKDTIEGQKECLMPLRIALASGKMPSIGTSNKKKSK